MQYTFNAVAFAPELGDATLRTSLLAMAFVACSVVAPADVLAQGCVAQAPRSGAGPLRPSLDSRPQALPDAFTVTAERQIPIDVLANDKGVPASGVELAIEQPPTCGNALVEGRTISYRGGSDCVGKSITLRYRIKLVDSQTCQPEWQSAPVAITVTAATLPPPPPPEPPTTLSCQLSNSPGRFVKIEGGQFAKTEAPAAISDFTRLIEDASFTVRPFCIMVEGTTAQEFEKFFKTLPEDQKRARFPEFFELGAGKLESAQGSDPASGVSRRMADAFVQQQGEGSRRTVNLPTLNELVAAAWELQKKQPDSPEAELLIVGLRSGNLQWTATPCAQNGRFFVLGPSPQGPLAKFCYDESRQDGTGFRLVIR